MANDFHPLLFDYHVNANVCKNDRCANLAVVGATEYIFPSYYLGFPALHCNKCGSNALLLNSDDINLLLLPKITDYLTKVKKLCPRCYSDNIIRYGKTQQKTQRLQCKACHWVYSEHRLTDKQQHNLIQLSELLFSQLDFKQITSKLGISYSHFYRLLKQLAQICRINSMRLEKQNLHPKQLHIVSKTKTFLVRGKQHNPTTLWGITSALSDSGYILLNNLNYTEQPISDASLYDSQQPTEPEKKPEPNISSVDAQYESFLRRKSFDQLPYHQEPFIYENMNIVEPVISAYSHFHELKHYYHAPKIYHYIQHEMVLRSAAITTFGDAVKNKNCTICYLYEHASQTKETHLITNHKIGWWENEWYAMRDKNQNIHKLLGLLTSTQQKLTENQVRELPASFSAITHFYNSLDHYFPAKKLAQLSPHNIQILWNIFTGFYNYCFIDNTGKTTAQKAKISTEPFTFSTFIQQYNDS